MQCSGEGPITFYAVPNPLLVNEIRLNQAISTFAVYSRVHRINAQV